MTSLDLFQQQAKASLLDANLDEVTLNTLLQAWEAQDGEALDALLSRAFTPDRLPILLQRAARKLPELEITQRLLHGWEGDANLQDDWIEIASGRQLQDAKAHYVQVTRALDADPEHDPAAAKTWSRILSKLSKALLTHPDNAQGQCDIYGDFKAESFVRTGKLDNTFRGQHLTDGHSAAIKVLKPELSANLPLVYAFVAGAEALRELRHPGVAAVLQPAARPRAFGDKVFAVTAWRGTHTLDDLLASLQPLQRLQAALQLTQALAWLHARGRVHGNLSPGNIIVAEDGGVVITGALAATDDLPPGAWAQIAMALGNPYYIAPELTSGALPSTSSDLFALGRVLFRLLTGKEENLYDVMVPQLYAQALQASLGEHPDLIAILQQTADLQAAARPAAAREILTQLYRYGGRLGAWSHPELDDLAAQGAWGSLADAAASVAAADPERRLLLLQRTADLQEHLLEDRQAALAAWAEVYREGAAGRALAADALERLRADLGDALSAQAVADAFAAAADGDVTDPAEALDLHLRAARLYLRDVGADERAIHHYRAALALQPHNEEAFAALDALFNRLLDWGSLVALLHDRVAASSNTRDKINLLFRIARVEEDSRWDAAAAAAAYAQALELNPAHPSAFQNLGRLLRELGRWDELADLLHERALRAEDPAAQLKLQLELLRVHRDHRDDPDAAVDLAAALLNAHPEHEDVVVELERLLQRLPHPGAAALLEPLYRARGDKPRLVAVLPVLLDSLDAEDPAWITTLREIATLHDDLEDRPRAIDAYLRLRRLDPQNPQTLQRLDALFEAEARWEELAELLRARAAAAAAPQDAAADLLRAADLLEGHLQRPLDAIATLQHLLSSLPTDAGALERLERLALRDDLLPHAAAALRPLYEGAGAWQPLADLIARQLERDPDLQRDAPRADAYARLAQITEHHLEQPTAAWDHARDALCVQPRRADLRDELERLTHLTLRFEDAAALYADHLVVLLTDDEDPQDAPLLVHLLHAAASWQRHHLDQPHRAVASLQLALGYDPGHDPSLDALDALYAELEHHAQRADILQHKAERAALTDRPDDRLLLLLDLARLAIHHLQDDARAVQALRTAHEEHPEDPRPLDALVATFQRLARFDELADALSRRAHIEPEPERRIALLTELGDVHLLHLQQPDDARDAWEQAAALKPAQPLDLLQRLLDLALTQGDIPAFFRWLPPILQHTRDKARLLDLRLQAARLAEHPDAPSDASPIEHFEAVLLLQPYHAHALDALEAHYQEHQVWDRLEDLLRRRFVLLHLKAAHLALHGLQNNARALEHLLQARRLDPHRVEVLDRLIELYEHSGDAERLQETLDLRLDLVDDQPDEKATLLLKRAAAFVEGNDEIKALDALTRALTLRPVQDTEHLLTFARLALAHGRFDERAPQILGALRAQALDPGAAPLLPALDTAIRASLAFSEERPEEALLDLQELRAAPTLDPDLLLDLLRAIFAHHGAQERFARDLAALADLRPEDPAWSDAILTRSAELAEAQGDPEAALDAFTTLFQRNPANRRARQHMLRLANDLQQPQRALDAIEQRLQRGVEDDRLAIDLYLGLAAHFDRADADADDLRRALRYYREASGRAPQDRHLLQTLARLLRALGERADLIHVLDNLLDLLAQDPQRTPLLLELAHLHRDHSQNHDHSARLAVDLLQIDLPLDDDHRAQARDLLLDALEEDRISQDVRLDVLQRLEREFSLIPDDSRVYQLLHLHLDLLDEHDHLARARVLERLAASADLLAFADEALRFRLQHLTHQPDHHPLRDALRELALPEGEHTRAVALAWHQLAAHDDLPALDRAALAAEAAAWFDTLLHEPEPAVELLQLTLSLDPGHPDAPDALQALLQRLNRFEDLVELLLHRARRAQDPDARRDLTFQAARVAEDDLQLPERAEAAYLLLLDDFGPDAAVLARLEAIHERADNPAGQLRVLQARIELAQSDDPSQIPHLTLKAAQLAAERLRDLPTAIDLYERLRDAEPMRPDLLAALADLYAQEERWSELLLTTEQRAALTDDDDERFQLTLTTARIAADHLNDLDTAIACLRDAHALQPDNAEVTERLFGALERDLRWEELRDILLADMEAAAHDPQTQARLALHLSALALDPARLNDRELGKAHLAFALQINPEDRDAVLLLLDLSQQDEAWTDVVAALDRLIAITPEPADQIPLLIQQSDLYQGRLNDPELAIHALYRAWELDADGTSGVRDRLVQLYADLQLWDAIIQTVQYDIDRCADVAEQVALELQLATLIRERANNPTFLIQILERAWNRNPEPLLALDILTQLIDAWVLTGALAHAGPWIERGFDLAEQLGAKDKLALLWFHKGRADYAAGHIEAAVASHQECYKLDGRRLDNILLLGQLLYETQKWDDALKALQVALLKQNELSDAERLDMYYLMGMIRYETGDPRRAKDMFRRALSVDKAHAPSLAMIEHLG